MKYILFFLLLLFPLNCYADELLDVPELETEVNEPLESDDNLDLQDLVESDPFESDVPESEFSLLNESEPVETVDYSESINDIFELQKRSFVALQVCELCLISLVLLPRFRRIADKASGSRKGGK